MEWPGNKVVWDPKKLEEDWYRNNHQFIPQDIEREFGYTPVERAYDMSYAKIGEELGVSDTMARRVCNRAIAKLRKGLKAAGITKEDLCDGQVLVTNMPREVREICR